MATTTTSGFFRLNLMDGVKSAIVSALSAGLATLYSALTTTPVHIDWKLVGVSALTGGVGYAIKNLLTPAAKVTTPPPPSSNS